MFVLLFVDCLLIGFLGGLIDCFWVDWFFFVFVGCLLVVARCHLVVRWLSVGCLFIVWWLFDWLLVDCLIFVCLIFFCLV